MRYCICVPRFRAILLKSMVIYVIGYCTKTTPPHAHCCSVIAPHTSCSPSSNAVSSAKGAEPKQLHGAVLAPLWSNTQDTTLFSVFRTPMINWPNGLYVDQSSIPNAQLGLFAARAFPKGLNFIAFGNNTITTRCRCFFVQEPPSASTWERT